MSLIFSLINGLEPGPWHDIVKEALAPYGTLDIVGEKDAVHKAIENNYAASIIDASTVNEPSLLISRLLAQRPETRVVVVTGAPTWEFARKVFQAGAVDCIEKSNEVNELRITFKDILSRQAPVPLPPAVPDDADGLSGPILLADNQKNYLVTWKEILEGEGYSVLPAASPLEARRILERGEVILGIIDERLQSDDDDKDVSGLALAKEVAPEIPKIILTKYPDFESVRDVMKPGHGGARSAIDVVNKGAEKASILAAVKRAVEIAEERLETKPWWRQHAPMLAILALFLALGAGTLAIITGNPSFLLATILLVIFVVLFVGVSIR